MGIYYILIHTRLNYQLNLNVILDEYLFLKPLTVVISYAELTAAPLERDASKTAILIFCLSKSITLPTR